VRRELPTGTVTFLFTDVEGSTKLLHELGAEAYAEALAEHRRIVRRACAAGGGVEVDTQGDAFFFAFGSAAGAAAAAQAMTEALAPGRIRLRIGLHTGTPVVTDEGYVGDDVHLAARVAASGHGGQVVLSRATGVLLDGQSLSDLGEHRLKDIEGAVAILQLGDTSFPPLKTISNTNLPRPASSFVGRTAELAEVLALIEGGSRLVTLTGPGGSGKTRLALEVAARLVPSYTAGTFWVGLASLRDPSLVIATISQTIGSANGLAEHIGERDLLLLLDNLEHVIDAAPELSALLPACPSLTLLVTSRELLRVQGEVEFEVPPLASADAVDLFCERSRHGPSEDVVELCTRLDDLPLALELAAARAKAISVSQILERLSQRLDLLQGGRDADPRQQTLRATIEWSHELLSPGEQEVFARLSVFAGGCTLEAAEEIADASLDTLQSLVEKSLLRFTRERYWLLETIREYAREELEQAEDLDRVHDVHARWYASRAEERAYEIGREEPAALAWAASEIDNLRAALTTFIELARVDEAVTLTAQLASYFRTAGAHRELVDRVATLEGLGPARTSELAKLQRISADSARTLGDADRYEAMLAVAAATAEAAGDEVEGCRTALSQGRVLYRRGDAEDARGLMDSALARLRDLAEGRDLASSLYTYGSVLLEAREPERALPLLNEALEISRRDELEYGVAVCTQALGWAQAQLGNYPVSLALCAESAARFADLGDREGASYGLVNCSAALAHLRDPDLAATLLGVWMRITAELGIPQQPDLDVEEARALLEQLLGSARVAELAAAADALGDDEAIHLATEAAARFHTDRAAP
jgi:predicted ATPase